MFCLVSRQAMANVLPVFMYKPTNVVLFTTPEENQCASNLEILFKSKRINVIRKNNLNAYDYASFKSAVLSELENNNDEVILNVTGGTKLMAFAAYEAFAEKDKKIIYCDTEHQKIITLFPKYSSTSLNAELSIEDYLKSYGYNIIETKSPFTESDYFNFFRFIEKERLMRSLVNLYTNVRQKLSEEKPRFTVESDDKKIRFQKNLDTYIIHYGNKTENSFKVQSNDFKSGDWLEYYIYYKLKTEENLSTLMGVKISNPQGVENEIDVIALKDFRLYLYSCKTGKKDNQFDLYQLETLRNITSGTFGKGIFVTSNQHSEKFLKRAKELSIDVKNVLDNNLKFI
ncbi:MAG: Card1-like endonuclease domain-containing protein [Ignavibacterium sp.]|uniref:Card1-like endonuclease domain-containing protein n=1 Tax=Ignavibacterium sp. TaxID=2651167 RepID=UPI00404AB8EA